MTTAIRSKRWRISPSIPKHEQSGWSGLHPVVAQILYNRGFASFKNAEDFLYGRIRPADPFRMKGMAAAVGRIRHAIKKRELIAVYGDFDADGVTSTALLVSTLKALGANVRPYIPHRVDEGYGLNDDALIKLAKSGVKLVITVDCGIRSLREAETGRRAGLDMIITDHHSVGPDVPNALAVINPKQSDCHYQRYGGSSMLAGVGVTFRLAEALLKASAVQEKRELPITTEDLIDLVAIGTVADLVPLDQPENRALVVSGLEQLRQARRLGIKALLEAASMKAEQIDAQGIGFGIGPRINAAGRLKSAMSAYELLVADDLAQAAERATKLNELNTERQKLTREMQDYARRLAGLDYPGRADVPLIFAADSNFKQGIVGLVAGRLTEEFYRPSIVIHRGEHESHGSCRSIAEFNITDALDECADLLLRHGGHAQAAGFAIANENLPQFQEQITAIAADQLIGQDLQPTLSIDMEVRLQQIDIDLCEALRSLEPCGNNYPSAVLCARRVRVVEARTVGKEGAHLKLRVTDDQDVRDGIGFGFGTLAEELPRYVDVAFVPEVNEWNGSRRAELRLVDIRAVR